MPNCKPFLVTEAERKHVRQRARFQQHGDASCHQGKAPKEIHAILIETLREHAPLYATIKNWVALFTPGYFSTCDAPRPGQPKTVTTLEIIDQIHELILVNRRISATSIAEQLGISRERVGFIIFWDQDSILLIDYHPKGQTINAEYYSSLLVQMKDISKEKRRGKVTKGVLFLHDIAPAYRALATQKKLAYLGFQCLDHPPYSPDLAPSDYHLLPRLKKQLKNHHFSSDAEVIAAVETWLDGQPSECFLSGLQKSEQWAKKCIELRGEYVE